MDGKPIKIKNARQALAHGIGYATENRKFDGLALSLDVQYNINMAHLKQLSRFGFIDDKEGMRNAEEYIDKLKIKTPGLRQKVRNLSEGINRRLYYPNGSVMM